MKTIDVVDKPCPLPLIATKKALKESDNDEQIKIISNSETSVKNVTRYLEDNGIIVKEQIVGDSFELVFNKNGEEPIIEEAEKYCTSTQPDDKGFAVVFGKDRVGEGSEELGKMMVGGMLTAFFETERIPEKIIFMNSGINLVIEGSNVLDILTKLEKNGSKLLVCGTCLEYYNKINYIKVGNISNMDEILEVLTSYTKVVNI